jgi:hypothetical protein
MAIAIIILENIFWYHPDSISGPERWVVSEEMI